MLFLELFREVVDDAHVKIFTAEERVAVGGFDFEQAVVDFKDGNVERTAAKVIDRDGLCILFVEPVSQRRRCRLVDNAQDFEARDLARVLRCLTLGVVEIGRNGDDRLGHFLAEIRLGGFFHLAKDERGNLAWGVFLALGFDPGIAVAAVDHVERHVLAVLGQIRIVVATTDQTLDAEDGVFRVGDGLPLCGLADETLVVCERNDGRCRARAFRVLDHAGLAAVHDGNARVCSSKVNTNYFGHVFDPSFYSRR